MIGETKTCQKCGVVFTHARNDTRGKYCSRECGFSHHIIKSINDFEEDSSLTYYFAGFLFGDGYVKNSTMRVGLAKNDDNMSLLKRLSDYLFGYDNVKNYKLVHSLTCTNPELAKNLERFGISYNKTMTGVFEIPELKYANDFIRGYFDADGWISNNFYTNFYTNKSARSSGEVKECRYQKVTFGMCSYREENMLKAQSFIPTKTYISKKKTQTLYELRSSNKNELRELRSWLYSDDCICLENKKGRFWDF
jgi:hypothetical protein